MILFENELLMAFYFDFFSHGVKIPLDGESAEAFDIDYAKGFILGRKGQAKLNKYIALLIPFLVISCLSPSTFNQHNKPLMSIFRYPAELLINLYRQLQTFL